MYGFSLEDEENLRGLSTTLSDIQSRLAVPIPSAPTLLPIRTEADAAIGADGRKLSNYIDENTNTVSRPLIPDAWTDGYHGEPSLSFAPSESDLTESEYEDLRTTTFWRKSGPSPNWGSRAAWRDKCLTMST